MKGVIFTELVRFMEHAKSPDFSDDVIEQAAVESGGAYSSVGNYPATEALALVGKAAELSGIEAGELCRMFGKYLYGRFLVLYPHIMEAYTTAEELLTHVGSHIHGEVVILYPDARPPLVEARTLDGNTILTYESHRPLAAVAHGLVQGCMEHYGDTRALEWTVNNDGRNATFTLKG
jgi:hypothetical protein